MNRKGAGRLVPLLAAALGAGAGSAADDARDPRETHLAELRQLTFGGENAEAYWSPDGAELVFQSTRPPLACDQIFRAPLADFTPPRRVSPGAGRATCAYFTHDGARILFSSTHAAGEACPPPPDRSQGYVWAIYPTYEIWSARPDGGDLRRLTDNQAYDAEATVCARDGSVVFTSTRDGDLELYRMDADGGGVRRLTEAPGYDGGAFFSPDCTRIVWRASRPRDAAELADYQELLRQGLVRPGRLELWAADADGTQARQITFLDAASFAPSFFPGGDRVIFSSNFGQESPREFDLWAVDLDGGGLERVTWSSGFDGFPMFSPDGGRLAFASNRRQGRPGETNLFVARWVDHPPAVEPRAADRFLADVRWLADDARQGRGLGTAGLAQAADWLERRFAALGLQPAGEAGGWRQPFEVVVAVEVEPSTELVLDGRALERDAFQPAGFSPSATVEAAVVPAGYGIVAPELGRDDYDGVAAAGQIVVVRRFVPPGEAWATDEVQRRYGDVRYKAWTAREHGAVGLLVVDQPEPSSSPAPPAAAAHGSSPPEAPPGGEPPPEEAPLPRLAVDGLGESALPVVFVRRAPGAPLLAGGHQVRLRLALTRRRAPAHNVVGRLPAGAAAPLGGAVLLGAHYDHLGMGGPESMEPDARAPHNGADDNASGTAALLEAARTLAARRAELRRDVWFVAFAGEEAGVLGSTAFTRQPPAGLRLADLVAMVNMDMVGRLRQNRLTVLAGESASEWPELVGPLCRAAGLDCTVGGDGYGPSDHTPFYAAGVPVLHLFTGAHDDYHRPSDDADRILAAGGAQVAGLAAELAATLARRDAPLTYRAIPSPPPRGDVRSYGASLGTVPDYAGPPGGRPGVLLAGVRPGGPAEKAGLQRGDILVRLAGHEIATVHDFMFVLRAVKPGQTAVAVVDRGGRRLELTVTFGTSTRMR